MGYRKAVAVAHSAHSAYKLYLRRTLQGKQLHLYGSQYH